MVSFENIKLVFVLATSSKYLVLVILICGPINCVGLDCPYPFLGGGNFDHFLLKTTTIVQFIITLVLIASMLGSCVGGREACVPTPGGKHRRRKYYHNSQKPVVMRHLELYNLY